MSTKQTVTICLVTRQYQALTAFYEAILGVPCKHIGENYCGTFQLEGCRIEILTQEAQEAVTSGATQLQSNKNVVLGFETTNIQQEYSRLRPLVQDWVTAVTTDPFETQAIYFRDPDGNLLQFFQPA